MKSVKSVKSVKSEIRRFPLGRMFQDVMRGGGVIEPYVFKILSFYIKCEHLLNIYILNWRNYITFTKKIKTLSLSTNVELQVKNNIDRFISIKHFLFTTMNRDITLTCSSLIFSCVLQKQKKIDEYLSLAFCRQNPRRLTSRS